MKIKTTSVPSSSSSWAICQEPLLLRCVTHFGANSLWIQSGWLSTASQFFLVSKWSFTIAVSILASLTQKNTNTMSLVHTVGNNNMLKAKRAVFSAIFPSFPISEVIFKARTWSTSSCTVPTLSLDQDASMMFSTAKIIKLSWTKLLWSMVSRNHTVTFPENAILPCHWAVMGFSCTNVVEKAHQTWNLFYSPLMMNLQHSHWEFQHLMQKNWTLSTCISKCAKRSKGLIGLSWSGVGLAQTN